MSRITLQGRDWLNPAPRQTAWQRETERGPLLPIANDFTGRRGWVTWPLLILVASIMWTALFALVLA